VWHRPLLHVSYLPIQVLKTSLLQGKASWPGTADDQTSILLTCREGVRFTIVAFCTFQYNNNKAYFDVKKCTLIICTDNSENKVRKIRTNQSWKNLP
jgi:hypothetical protein